MVGAVVGGGGKALYNFLNDRPLGEGVLGFAAAGAVVGAGGGALVARFGPSAAAAAAPTLPVLTSGKGSQMFQQAMGHLSNMNASGRVEAFRGFAAQISKADPSWKATELAARNATVFAGDAGGRIIAFDQSGNMFRGIGAQTSAALQIQKGGEIVVDFLKLTPIK